MSQPADREKNLSMRVRSRREAAERVAILDLEVVDGESIPSWSAGAHIDLMLGPDLIRQYSLCGSPRDEDVLRIAVLREDSGRGGSAFVYDNLHEGAEVSVRGPRNNFELDRADSYVFIAGGIGITPLIPMIEEARGRGARWELHYGGRNRAAMAFAEDLPENGLTHFYPEDSVGLIDLPAILDEPRPDTLVYCCGPEPLLNAVEGYASRWPSRSIHLERFSPKTLDPTASSGEFEVELASSGVVLQVPQDKSVLEVLEEADVEVFSSCQDGTCGTCETMVLSGEVDHRDSVMTPEEQAVNDRMYVCVSRAACPKLLLDL